MIPRVLSLISKVSIPTVLEKTLEELKRIFQAMITSEQVRAARALLRWEQRDLANASGVSLPSIKRLEGKPGNLAAQGSTILLIQLSLEAKGIEFLNHGQPGVRLVKGVTNP